MTSEEKKIFAGELYWPEDPELVAIKERSHILSQEYSALREDQRQRRAQILEELLGAFGEGSWMFGPIFFHYGKHTKIGKGTFANYNFTVQDDAPVTIGDHCNFGPNVTIVTPLHPLDAQERRAMEYEDGTMKTLCYARPVVIGNDCWICANAVILPGVTIGDGCVIGAGSVVTHDIPARSLAMGVPCRVVREITEADRLRP